MTNAVEQYRDELEDLADREDLRVSEYAAAALEVIDETEG